MHRPPPLVATDLDGTLLRSDGTVSERTSRALRRVEEAGSSVVFVTGRPPRWLDPVVEMTGHTGMAVCANGALVLDLHRDEVVAEHVIAVEVLTDVVARLRKALPGLAFAVERRNGFAREADYRATADAGGAAPGVVIGEDLYDAPAVKLLARHGEADADELLAAAREIVGDAVELTHSTRGAALIEMSAGGVSKASALAMLCDDLGIAADDVVAFGDMPNDLPMLAWAGRPYAMANAHAEVLAAVPGRAPSNDEDGVATVIEQLFGGVPHSASR